MRQDKAKRLKDIAIFGLLGLGLLIWIVVCTACGGYLRVQS